jgi:hypothetical protein
MTQPEALRLADEVQKPYIKASAWEKEAAAELRRLHAQRDALLKLLKDVLPVAEDASESLGRFCSDEGWAQEDMDRMDNVDGMLPLMRAAIKAVEEGKC